MRKWIGPYVLFFSISLTAGIIAWWGLSHIWILADPTVLGRFAAIEIMLISLLLAIFRVEE